MLNIACLKEAITSFEQRGLSFIRKGGALAPLLYSYLYPAIHEHFPNYQVHPYCSHRRFVPPKTKSQ